MFLQILIQFIVYSCFTAIVPWQHDHWISLEHKSSLTPYIDIVLQGKHWKCWYTWISLASAQLSIFMEMYWWYLVGLVKSTNVTEYPTECITVTGLRTSQDKDWFILFFIICGIVCALHVCNTGTPCYKTRKLWRQGVGKILVLIYPVPVTNTLQGIPKNHLLWIFMYECIVIYDLRLSACVFIANNHTTCKRFCRVIIIESCASYMMQQLQAYCLETWVCVRYMSFMIDLSHLIDLTRGRASSGLTYPLVYWLMLSDGYGQIRASNLDDRALCKVIQTSEFYFYR